MITLLGLDKNAIKIMAKRNMKFSIYEHGSLADT